MDEKILIKSEMDKKARNVFIGLIIGLFTISAILFVSLRIETEQVRYHPFTGGSYTVMVNGIDRIFDGDELALSALNAACFCFLLGIVVAIVFLVYRKCEIVVTEKNVRGKTLFGKKVVLPIYMISAYSTRSFMSTVAVSTSSGLTKFSLIGNYAEIGNVLSIMINERQENTVKIESNINASNSSMEDLIKLKNLLDMGIITQEEFDTKKKQILNL